MTFRGRRSASLVLAATLLSGCAAGHTAVVDPAPAGQAADALTVATTSPATSLDFTTVGGAAIPAALMNNVYETLVAIDSETGEVVPQLATSWEVSADGTHYVFQLRRGVRFSNGSPFNAETAAFSLDYVKNHWSNALSSQMDVVKSARATGEHELTVDLHQRSNSWLWQLGTTVGAMMTPDGVGELASRPVGTGPYAVSKFSPNEFVALDPRDDYWGTPAAQPVTISYFPDSLTALNALRSGGADVVWAVQSPELLDDLPDGIEKHVGTTNGEVLLSLNNQAAPFDDPRVRQAVAYAIDRQAASEILFGGLATDTGAAPVAPTDPWFTGEDYYPFDPQRARQLLHDAGAVGAPITITVPTLPYAQTAAELIYSQLTEVGFDVRLESAEFPAVWLGQVMGAHDYQVSLVSHVEPRDLTTLFGSPDYYLGYDSPRVRELFAAADTAATPEGFRALTSQAVDQIMAEAGAVTLMNMPNIVLSRPGVTGLRPDMVTDSVDLTEVSAR